MRRILSLLIVLAVPPLQAEVPLAPGLRMIALAREMHWNGIPMQVQHFTSRKPPEQVLGWYRQKWQVERNGESVPMWVETKLEPWTLLTHREGDYMQTVQIRSGAEGSEGWLGEIRLSDLERAGNARLAADFPRMRGSELINDLRTKDIGQKGAVILLRNGFSVASNASFYREHYVGRGWHVDADMPVADGHLLVFRRGPQEINITISEGDDGRRYVVANPVSRGLLP